MNEEEFYKNLLDYFSKEVYGISYQLLEDGSFIFYMHQNLVDGIFTSYKQMLEKIAEYNIQEEKDTERSRREMN
jgi:hypothetical protein